MNIINNYAIFLTNKYQSTKYTKKNVPYKLSTNSLSFRSNDLLNLNEKEIFKIVDNSIKEENFLGCGLESNVYRIKDTPYCVKTPKYKYPGNSIRRYNANLNNEDKINHVRAKLGGNTFIMDYIEGVTLKQFKDNKTKQRTLRKQVSEMPLETYKDLLYQITNAIKSGMIFDCNSGNVIIDTKKNKLTAIDFFKVAYLGQLITEPLVGMFNVLAHSNASDYNVSEKIGYKILQTGVEELKPEIPTNVNLETFGFSRLLKMVCEIKNKSTSEDANKLDYLIQRLVFFKSTNRFAKEIKEDYPQVQIYLKRLFGK